MDKIKWKSVAVRTENYNLLRGLCKRKFRTPGSFVEKLLHEYIEFQAKKEKTSAEKYKQKLLNGEV